MKKEQSNYIVFLLGADNFDICKLIRKTAKEHSCIDELYEDCKIIAKQFEKYDKENYNKISQYESFERFLQEYDEEIKDFITRKTDDFDIN